MAARVTRMPLKGARTIGEAADILVCDKRAWAARTDTTMVEQYILALSALWLNERALRIEIAALKARSRE